MVFSLIVMLFLLMAAVSITTVTISETKSSSALARSTNAYIVAESGMEIILKRIYSNAYNGSDLNALAPSGTSCQNGEIRGTIGDGQYAVTLLRSDGSPIATCSTTTWRTEAAGIESQGAFGTTTRAIRVDVAPAT